MNTDYTAFDTALIAHIAAGRNTANDLDLQVDVHRLAEPHRGADRCSSDGKTPVWRVIDRRLQALRKKDFIRYNRATGQWGLWIARAKEGGVA